MGKSFTCDPLCFADILLALDNSIAFLALRSMAAGSVALLIINAVTIFKLKNFNLKSIAVRLNLFRLDFFIAFFIRLAGRETGPVKGIR